MIRQMDMKPMIFSHSKIAFIALILPVLCPFISAAESTSPSKIPHELIARKIKKHEPSLAISVEAVLYKIKRNQKFTLVDVRSRPEFERLHIPGSVNIALYALKTKAYLKSAPVVLVNQGFHYGPLENECRRLTERGFRASILDGGLPAWKRKGGQLVGDLFALEGMKAVSPQVFFLEKDYEDTLVIDVSPTRTEASRRLIPHAGHIPVGDVSDSSAPTFRKMNAQNKNKPFRAIVIFNETGEQYEKAELILSRMGTEAFFLQGGIAGYQKYLEGLMLSWKPRGHRLKTVSNCKPCGTGGEYDFAGSE
jgi:rhodanese-related sulfurtransferase